MTRTIGGALGITLLLAAASAAGEPVQLGPRPFYLLDALADGPLKQELSACRAGPFEASRFSIGHRGAALQFPEHTEEGYLAAARMGAGILECDVTFTKDRELVCRHDQCDLHTTTNILSTPLAEKCREPFSPADPATGREATARCCTADLTLAEFKSLKGKMDAADDSATTIEAYQNGIAPWRTDLYAADGTLMSHAESIALFDRLGLAFTPELKTPEVAMPFEGTYGQADFAQALIDAYKEAGINPARVFPQSFDLEDIRNWLKTEPEFGAHAVFLDGRYSDGLDFRRPETFEPSMAALKAEGLRIIAPPIWMLLDLNAAGKIVPSAYAEAARAAGLGIITWTLERSGPLDGGGGWYFQSITDQVTGDGAVYQILDVLARDVGIIGIFSDWPATVTFFANCRGLG
jgi:glycerophosphoryl diester phosphodiesterase